MGDKKEVIVTAKADFFVVEHADSHVAHCTAETETSMWEETFGSSAEANAFLKGVQAGCSLLSGRAVIEKKMAGKVVLKAD